MIILRKSWEIDRNQLTISCQIVANILKLLFCLIDIKLYVFRKLNKDTCVPFICKLPCHCTNLLKTTCVCDQVVVIFLVENHLRTYCKMNKTPWFWAKSTKLVYAKECSLAKFGKSEHGFQVLRF